MAYSNSDPLTKSILIEPLILTADRQTLLLPLLGFVHHITKDMKVLGCDSYSKF